MGRKSSESIRKSHLRGDTKNMNSHSQAITLFRIYILSIKYNETGSKILMA